MGQEPKCSYETAADPLSTPSSLLIESVDVLLDR